VTSLVQWVDIPATDIHRAATFYRAVFDVEMQHIEMPPDYVMEWFTSGSDRLGVGLVQGGDRNPKDDGVLVYLKADDGIDAVLKRVESAGGSIVMAKSGDEENGYIAFFTDPEGNRIGLHSQT
jgi:uncharacterized protein